MVEPSTGVAAVASAVGIVGKVIQHSFAYREVPRDVQAFQSSIESFNATLGKARRLRRVTSHLLDSKDKEEIDMNISRAVEILDNISGTIEACRKDLANKGTVSSMNRLLWLVRDHHMFLSRTHSFGICHQSLNSDINGMRQLQGTPQPPPPAYNVSEFEGSLCPPSRRRPLSEPKKLRPNTYELEGISDWKSPNLMPMHIPVGEQSAANEDNSNGMALTRLTPWRSSSSLTLVSSSSPDDGRSTTSEQYTTSTNRTAPWRTRRSFGSSYPPPSECETSSIMSEDTRHPPSLEPVSWRRTSSGHDFQPSYHPDFDTKMTSGDYNVNTLSTASWRTRSNSDLSHTPQLDLAVNTESGDYLQHKPSVTPRRQRRGFMIT